MLKFSGFACLIMNVLACSQVVFRKQVLASIGLRFMMTTVLRSNLVARPTVYRRGKLGAHKTVKHRDKSEKNSGRSLLGRHKTCPSDLILGRCDIGQQLGACQFLIMLAFSSTCWKCFLAKVPLPVPLQRLAFSLIISLLKWILIIHESMDTL